MAPPQWAYQVEHFVNEPDEELVCSICRSVFCDPVMCPCDHVFCQACVTKWLQTNRNCPICRKRVSHSSVKKMVPIIKNIIMKLMINCHNKSLGCSAQFSLESSEVHVKECEYELVPCKNKPCKDRLFRKDILEHETSDCPHRYIKCQKCRSKMPTSASIEKHDCIQALRARLRRKSIILRKKNAMIEKLEKENQALITGSQGAEQPVSSTSGDYVRPRSLRNLSPDEIMINIAEFESTSSSLSSDSDDSRGGSIFVSDSPGGHSDNAESDSFLSFIDNAFRVENQQDENMVTQESAVGYSHVGSQTTDDLVLNGQNTFGSNSNSAEASSSALNTEERSQTRQLKRRPTAQKPAKRRLPPLISSSDDESMEHSSVQTSKQCWLSSSDSQRGSEESSPMDNGSSCMEAGPSSESVPGGSSAVLRVASSKGLDSHFKLTFHPRPKRGNNTCMSSETVSSGNAVFERTLELMNQYNLDSDPEWLPEYASHRGDTPSPSNSDSSSIDESSSSEASDAENEDNPNGNCASSDLVKWMYHDSTSDEDDPDFDPLPYLEKFKMKFNF